jgi:hypothetical protein
VIVFDLRCAGGHVFEAWFASGDGYEDQRRRGLVACPTCGDTDVGKAAMAPAVKGNARESSGSPDPRRMLAALAAAQAETIGKSTWVGPSFASRARAMHDGAEPHALIHGQATPDEARSLAEDGVAVAPLLVPVVPPGERN